jgi:uncharacterized protein (TIGR04255 family)
MVQSAMTSNPLPERIDPDAIVEALVEFRFEHAELAEAIVGRLLDAPLWAGYSQERLPTADIPQPIRESNEGFRYLPTIELRNKENTRIAKLGGHVFSYHVLPPYPGWSVFRQELESVLSTIIEKLKSDIFSRLGFRYINILRPDEHHVSSLSDTNITVTISNERLINSVNLNYRRTFETNHTVTVKVSTPEFVAGQVRPGYSLLCDIDVATKAEVSLNGFEAALGWINTAHDLEKDEFFKILPDAIIQQLSVKEEAAK